MEFAQGPLIIVPYDIVLSHQERWMRPNDQRQSAADPTHVPSSKNQLTTKYVCVKEGCVYGRYPYFRRELLLIPDDVNLQQSHKALIERELKINL
jgi:hypothetical protein